MTPLDLHMDKAQGVIGQFLEWTIRTPWRVIVGLGLLIPMSSTGFSPGYYLLRDVLALITTVILMAISSGNASAETFRFPAAARAAYGVPQVDIAMSVYMHPDCAGRWFVEYPPGFAFRRGGPNGGNLYGNPGRGSYDVAIKTDACPSRDSDYVEPARTTWHKVVVY